MIIIGITGTIGAGKGTIVEYLKEKFGFTHYSVRQYLIGILQDKGIDVNRDTMVSLANNLRAMNGSDYIAQELFVKAKENGRNCVIESIRTEGEVISLRKKGDFYLLAVDAKAELRYERIKLRKSETDMISFDEFLANERREMDNTDSNKQNLRKCIELSDFQFENNEGIGILYEKIDSLMHEIMK